VLSDQLTRWCCIDPLSWHDLLGKWNHFRVRGDVGMNSERVRNRLGPLASSSERQLQRELCRGGQPTAYSVFCPPIPLPLRKEAFVVWPGYTFMRSSEVLRESFCPLHADLSWKSRYWARSPASRAGFNPGPQLGLVGKGTSPNLK